MAPEGEPPTSAVPLSPRHDASDPIRRDHHRSSTGSIGSGDTAVASPQDRAPNQALKQMPTPAQPDANHPSHPDHPRHADWKDDPDAAAEKEFGMYGGDAPEPPRPKLGRALSGRSTREQRSGGASFMRRITPSTRTPAEALSKQSTQYFDAQSEPFPPLFLTDSAFSDSHRIRDRAYSQISRRTTVGGRSEQTLSNEEADAENKKKEDPNKVVWADGDPENPQNWSNKYKWFLTLIGALLTVNVTFASSAPSSATMAIAKAFNVSTEASTLMTSIFLCGYVGGPILWAPMSELFGRKPVFVGTMFCYVVLQLGDALGKNFGTLLSTRFLAGLFAASPLTNAGGLIADIWDPIGRGPAMSVFTASVFIGPVLGPIVSSFVTVSYLGWRWVFWLIGIFGLFSWSLVVVFLPETYSPVLLAKRARKLRKQDPEKNKDLYGEHERADFSIKGIVSRTLGRPFVMLATEPILILVTIYLSIVYGLLYSLFSAFPIIWEETRGFSLGQGGLIFIGVGIGTTLGAALNIWLQKHYRYLVPKWHGHPPCEERLYGAIIAGPCLIIGIFWLGWTGNYPSVPWYVPALATIPLGMSFTLVFISFLSYLIDVYLMYSASALAANTIVRSAVGAAFPLFTTQMYDTLTIKWACTLVGGIAIIIAPSPLAFYLYGDRLRGASKFAPALDIHMAETVREEEARELRETGTIVRHDGLFEKFKRKQEEHHAHKHDEEAGEDVHQEKDGRPSSGGA